MLSLGRKDSVMVWMGRTPCCCPWARLCDGVAGQDSGMLSLGRKDSVTLWLGRTLGCYPWAVLCDSVDGQDSVMLSLGRTPEEPDAARSAAFAVQSDKWPEIHSVFVEFVPDFVLCFSSAFSPFQVIQIE